MSNYIAMLRGVNVSGHNIIKMEQLRASVAALGFGNVKTHVQSGNIVFTATQAAADGLSRKIAQKILREFGFSVPVFVKTSKEMEKIIKCNPFLNAPGINHSKLHVTFLAADAPPTALEQLQPLAVKPERLCITAQEIYLYCPNGYGITKLSNTAIEKKLAVGATTRNWKTVNTLLAMAR
jgi:uncharacterized protein (DUF1697 family)